MDYTLQLQYIYYIAIIAGFIISQLWKDKKNSGVALVGWVMVFILSYYIGARDLDTGVDTLNYKYAFDRVTGTTFSEWKDFLDTFGEDPIFKAILIIGHQIGDFQSTLWLISVLTLSISFVFSIRISRILGNNNPVAVFCCYLISFYCFGQQYNIIRAGLAAPLLLNFYLSLFQSRKRSALIYAVLALGIHFSSIIAILLAVVAKLWHFSIKTGAMIYFGAMILSFFGIGVKNIDFFTSMDNKKVKAYTGDYYTSFDYKTGFRYGFAAFNTIVYFLERWLMRFKNGNTALLNYLLRLFVLLSSIFFAWFTIPFSDRVGAFSWNIIPFMIFIAIWSHFQNRESLSRLISFLIISFMNLGISLISG